MALRIAGETYDNNGWLHRVEIHDSELGADTTDEYIIKGMPSRSYAGRSKDIYDYLKPSTLTWAIEVSPSSPAAAFVADYISNADENRYHVKWYMSNVLRMRGYLEIEQSSIPLKSDSTYNFSLKATDRLGKLDNYEYIPPDLNIVSNATSKVSHLINALNHIGVGDLYGDAEDLLVVRSTFHESQMGDPLGKDFLRHEYLDYRAFAEEVEQIELDDNSTFGDVFTHSLGGATTVPGTCRTVIKRIAEEGNMQVWHDFGRYYCVNKRVFTQPNATAAYRYAKTKVYNGTTTVGNTLTIGGLQVNHTGHYFYEKSGNISFVSPVKVVQIDHQIGSENNKIVGAEWNLENSGNLSDSFGDIDNSGDARVHARFIFDCALLWNSVPTIYGVYRRRFKFNVVIKIGDYYLKRHATLTGQDSIEYGNNEWTTSFNVVQVITNNLQLQGTFNPDLPNQLEHILDIESEDPIPDSGPLIVGVSMPAVVYYDGSSEQAEIHSGGLLQGGKYKIDWYSADNFIKIISDETDDNQDARRFIRHTISVNDNNTEVVKRELHYGDDPSSNSFNRIQISPSGNGIDLVDAQGVWSYNGLGPTYSYGELLGIDMAALRADLLQVLMGVKLRSNTDFVRVDTRLDYQGKSYLMINMREDTKTNHITGEWIQIRDGGSSKSTIKTKKYKPTKAIDPDSTVLDGPANTPVGDIVSGSSDKPKVHFVTGITTDYIDIPTTVGYLPNPAEHTPAEMMYKLRGTMKGSGNLIYRETLVHPSHINITVSDTTNRIQLYRAAKATDEFFISFIE